MMRKLLNLLLVTVCLGTLHLKAASAPASADPLYQFFEDEPDTLVIAPMPFELDIPSLGIGSDPKEDLALFLRPPSLQNFFTDLSGPAPFHSNRMLEQSDIKIPEGVSLTFIPPPTKPVRSWNSKVINSRGAVVKEFKGEGKPPETLIWDGQEDGWSRIQAGEPYNFTWDSENTDGSASHVSGTPMIFPFFSLRRDKAVAIYLASSEIFIADSAVVSERGRTVLLALCEILAEHPLNPISIDIYATELTRAQSQSAVIKEFIANTLMKHPDELMTEIQVDPHENESVKVQILGVKK